MSLIKLSLKNVKLIKVKVLCIILMLAMGLAFMNVANNISESSLKVLNQEYKNLEDNRIIRISSDSGRELDPSEIEFINKNDNIENINLDYYLSLTLQNENQMPIYKAKVQSYYSELEYKYNYLEKDKEGIFLPNISVQVGDGRLELRTLAGRDVYFEIERINKYNEAEIIPYMVHVSGVYETNQDEYTAPILVSSNILDKIYEQLEEKKVIYECTATIKEGKNIFKVAEEIERIGLETNYKQKSYMESKDNIRVFVTFVRVLQYILLLFGLLALLIFLRNKFVARNDYYL